MTYCQMIIHWLSLPYTVHQFSDIFRIHYRDSLTFPVLQVSGHPFLSCELMMHTGKWLLLHFSLSSWTTPGSAQPHQSLTSSDHNTITWRNNIITVISLGRTRCHWKPPLEQSVTRRHLNFNADCFWNRLETYLFSRSFPSNCFQFLVLYTVYSSALAVLYLSHCK